MKYIRRKEKEKIPNTKGGIIMKKKIKDLTQEDITNICNRYWNCQQCPLYNPYGLEDCTLEQEVEVDESNND